MAQMYNGFGSVREDIAENLDSIANNDVQGKRGINILYISTVKIDEPFKLRLIQIKSIWYLICFHVTTFWERFHALIYVTKNLKKCAIIQLLKLIEKSVENSV